MNSRLAPSPPEGYVPPPELPRPTNMRPTPKKRAVQTPAYATAATLAAGDPPASMAVLSHPLSGGRAPPKVLCPHMPVLCPLSLSARFCLATPVLCCLPGSRSAPRRACLSRFSRPLPHNRSAWATVRCRARPPRRLQRRRRASISSCARPRKVIRAGSPFATKLISGELPFAQVYGKPAGSGGKWHESVCSERPACPVSSSPVLLLPRMLPSLPISVWCALSSLDARAAAAALHKLSGGHVCTTAFSPSSLPSSTLPRPFLPSTVPRRV